MAQPSGQAAPSSEPTPLSGFDVVAPRPKATDVSGVDVVVKRTPKVSELEVSVPLCPKAGQAVKAPEPATDTFKTGNSIVQGKGRFDDAPPPKVVSSFPAKGAMVRPGLLVLRVTFDRPMSCLGLIQSHAPLPYPCPTPLRSPMISRDKRTFLTVCKVEANLHYGLWLDNFAGAAGTGSPRPYELEFNSSGMEEITTVEAAIAQDAWLQKASNRER